MANTQTLLSLGYPQAMIQNQVYSMPNKTVIVACNTALVFGMEVTQTVNPITVAAVTNSGGFISSFPFVSSTLTNSTITCKPY